MEIRSKLVKKEPEMIVGMMYQMGNEEKAKKIVEVLNTCGKFEVADYSYSIEDQELEVRNLVIQVPLGYYMVRNTDGFGDYMDICLIGTEMIKASEVFDAIHNFYVSNIDDQNRKIIEKRNILNYPNLNVHQAKNATKYQDLLGNNSFKCIFKVIACKICNPSVPIIRLELV